MPTLGAVATALASTISAATGLRTFDHVPGDLDPPGLFISLGVNERGAMSRGQQEPTFDAVVFVSRAVDRVGQAALLEYASFSGTKSVWKAIDDTPALGLSDTNAAVIRYRPLGLEEMSVYGYFGGVFEVIVLTTGSS